MYTRWIARRMARCSLSLPAGSAICKSSVKGFSLTYSASVLGDLFRASGLTQRVHSHATTVDKGQSSINQPCLASSPHISELIWQSPWKGAMLRRAAAVDGEGAPRSAKHSKES